MSGDAGAVGTLALAEARRWLGTPYQHGASVRGVGCDCLGLVRGVWRAVHGAEPEAPPPYRPDWAELADGEPLLEAMGRWFDPLPSGAARAGDVLAFRMAPGAAAKHLAVLSGPVAAGPRPPSGGLDPSGAPRHLPAERGGEVEGRIIHAYWGRAVVESWLQPWWRRRVVGAFRWREIVRS